MYYYIVNASLQASAFGRLLCSGSAENAGLKHDGPNSTADKTTGPGEKRSCSPFCFVPG